MTDDKRWQSRELDLADECAAFQQRVEELEQQATDYAGRIRHLIALVEHEVQLCREQERTLAAHGDLNWRACRVAGDLAEAKVMGLRSALQIVTGMRE